MIRRGQCIPECSRGRQREHWLSEVVQESEGAQAVGASPRTAVLAPQHGQADEGAGAPIHRDQGKRLPVLLARACAPSMDSLAAYLFGPATLPVGQHRSAAKHADTVRRRPSSVSTTPNSLGRCEFVRLTMGPNFDLGIADTLASGYASRPDRPSWGGLQTMSATYDRQLLTLTASDLEKFVRDWVLEKKVQYFKIERFSGPGDRGRDIVGFVSQKLHEGDWDNFQCKQYAATLPTDAAFHEIGKILYYASLGEFTAPRNFKFVAPKGINRNLQLLLFKPTEFKQTFIAGWKQHCENTIIEGSSVPLTPELLNFIEAYDFARIGRVNLDDLVGDPSAKPVLFRWFGADPGPAPLGTTPAVVHSDELPYIGQLIDAYTERAGVPISNHEAAAKHRQFGTHLARQRERFYDADAFKRFYRDNTDAATISAFEDDIYHGVADICDGYHADALARADAVMSQAATVQPSGVLAQHSRVKAKQGICHHFANEAEPRLRWNKS